MDKQVIISISREYGSGGHEIAEKIAKQFGFKLYDRSILDEIAEAKNIQIEYLEKYDEKPRKLFGSRRVGAYTNSMEEIIAELQFEYLKEKADTGESFVIVGRCSETVLQDREGLISIFILGDEQVKLERIMKKYNLNEQDANGLRLNAMIRTGSSTTTAILQINGEIPGHMICVLMTVSLELKKRQRR